MTNDYEMLGTPAADIAGAIMNGLDGHIRTYPFMENAAPDRLAWRTRPWSTAEPEACMSLPDPESRRHSLDPAIGAMLAARRLALGWSYRDAGRHVGVSYGHLAMIERAERCPSLAVAEAIAAAYRLPAEDAARLLRGAVPDAGRSSPWRGGKPRRPLRAPAKKWPRGFRW